MKTILITGATSGVGEAAARTLASRGHRLLIIGRQQHRAEHTLARIRRASPDADVSYLLADLSLVREVDRLADEVSERTGRLDVLINNAGAFFLLPHTTREGLGRTFALNHLAYFHLTSRLLPLLERSARARVVNVASEAHRAAEGLPQDLDGGRGWWGWKAYARSKQCNILFTRELARRMQGGGVDVAAMHPGFVATRIGSNRNPIARVFQWLITRGARSPEEGADTVVWLADSAVIEVESGGYWVDRGLREPAGSARDDEAARRLWEESERIIREVLSAPGTAA